MNNRKYNKYDNIINIGSSMISAIVNKTTIAPLERIKILQQSENFYNNFRHKSKNKNSYNKYRFTNYNSVYNSLRYIYNNEGVYGLYKGNFINICRVLPSYILKFPLNEIGTKYFIRYKYLNKYFNKDINVSKEDIKIIENNLRLMYHEKLFVGIITGLTQITITYPLDFLRSRLSLDKNMLKKYNNNLFQYTKYVFKTENINSFYKGFSISSLTYPIYVGLQFSLFNQFKEYDFNLFISGALAGLIAQSIAFPGDVIKRHLQLNGVNNSVNKYKSVMDCIKYIYIKNGLSGFYTGIKVNIIKCIPGASIQFAVYDLCKNYGNKYIH